MIKLYSQSDCSQQNSNGLIQESGVSQTVQPESMWRPWATNTLDVSMLCMYGPEDFPQL